MGFKDAGKPHYLGHRERLRRRFRQAGPDSLPDYELLELVLFSRRAGLLDEHGNEFRGHGKEKENSRRLHERAQHRCRPPISPADSRGRR